MFPRIWRAKDVYGSILGGIILATMVEQFYYGMNTGLMVSVVAVALLSRHLEEESDPLRAAAAQAGRPTPGSVAAPPRTTGLSPLRCWRDSTGRVVGERVTGKLPVLTVLHKPKISEGAGHGRVVRENRAGVVQDAH